MQSEPVILPSARRHRVADEDMHHGWRNSVDAFELDEDLIMLVGPSRSAQLPEIGVVNGDEGPVIVHAMTARSRFLRRRCQLMPRSIQQILDTAEALADRFEHYEPDPADHRDPAPLAAMHNAVSARARAEQQLAEAIGAARSAGYSWATVGSLLGTSGEAARQRYGQLLKH